MALTIGDNFSYQGAKPLDARLQYETISEMKAKADSTLYDGIIAYCKADRKNYQWKSTNPVDETLGKWREFESSGGGGTSELANLDDVDLDAVADGDVLKYDAAEEKWVNGEVIGCAGRAKSTAIAPVFDNTAIYAEGDRVTYEDELYVFNKAHTGAWDAADADKSDVDTLTERMPATDMSEVASPMPGVMSRRFRYSTEEQVVGTWIDGKPIYQKTFSGSWSLSSSSDPTTLQNVIIQNGEHVISVQLIQESATSGDNYIASAAVAGLTNNENLRVKPTNNLSATAIVIQYTKTTD